LLPEKKIYVQWNDERHKLTDMIVAETEILDLHIITI
jgi:hypothetical protein